MSQRDAIFSHEEAAIADLLREDPDLSAEAIAEARDADPATVERSIRRIREKTDRAVATLARSPFLAEAAADLDERDRERILAGIDDG